ncbi:MAG: SDR family NAD(P)-dependent oxidoreductase [Chromatiales bacterium]|nr:SDR family NAD(P)-dependent oxidoreductase [Chromatiales bacterium]
MASRATVAVADLDVLAARAQRRLLAHPAVADCVVRSRGAVGHAPVLVAHVVAAAGVADEGLRACLEPTTDAIVEDARRNGYHAPIALIQINALPLRPDGSLDTDRLDRLPVLDGDTVHACERALKSFHEVGDAAAVIRAHRPLVSCPMLPMRALVPDSAPAADLVPDVDARAPGHGEPSIADGGELEVAPDAPSVLAGVLIAAASGRDAARIVHIDGDGRLEEETYRDLLEDARRVATGLRAAGLRHGARVLLQLGRSRDFIACFWACQLGGLVPVPLAVPRQERLSSADRERLGSVLTLLGDATVVADGPSAVALGDLDRVVAGTTPLLSIDALRAAPADPAVHASSPDDVALMLLTSGSTGTPKAVCQTHRALLARSRAWVAANGDRADDVTFNWMPLDHVGGVVMWHLRDVVVGCTQIHAPSEYVLRDPLRWLDVVDRYRVRNTWAPNFAYGLVCERAEEAASRRWDLSCVRYFLNGGEAVVARTARRFLEVLAPHGLAPTAMLPAWGMSETCSGVTFDDRFTPDAVDDDAPYVSVGRPIAGVSLRVVDADDRPLPKGQTGRLQIRGTTVTAGYLDAPQLTAEAFTADGWFVTGDLARMDERGVAITGREKDVIIINGINYSSSQIESVVEQVPGVDVSNTAACAARLDAADGERLAIFFTTSRAAAEHGALLDAIRERVREHVGIGPDYLIPLAPADIPKTNIGKIQRSRLRARLEAGDFEHALVRTGRHARAEAGLPAWFYRATWSPARLRASDDVAPSVTLLIADRGGVAQTLARALRTRDQKVVVAVAPDTRTVDTVSTVRVDASDRDALVRLLDDLADRGEAPGRVVHCLACDCPPDVGGSPAPSGALFGALAALQAVDAALGPRVGGGEPVELAVVTVSAQCIGDDSGAPTDASVLAGLLRTASIELSDRVRVRSVDLDRADVAGSTAALAHDLLAPGCEPEVAYRAGQRLVRTVEPIDMLAARPRSPFRDRGLYLLVGGLGGVGASVARRLAERYRLRMLVVGRTAIDGATPCGDGAPQARVRARRAALEALEQAGAEVMYRAVDVRDRQRLLELVEEAEQHWGAPLEGIVQLAGEGDIVSHWADLDAHRIVGEGGAEFEAMFAGKVAGTRALGSLLETRPRASLVLFSSVIGAFGAASYGAYAAANAFLEPYACHQRARGRRAWCLHWSMWDELGMSAGGSDAAQAAARSQGYHVLDADAGFASMLAVLGRDEPVVAIGVDEATPGVSRRLRASTRALESLVGYVVTSTADRESLLARMRAELGLRDAFGSPVSVDVIAVDAVPRTADGVLDLARVATAGQASAAAMPTGTPLERRIAAIWAEALRVERVELGESFFAIGGDSIAAAVAVNRVQQLLGVPVPLVALFGHPTVSALAAHLERRHPDAVAAAVGGAVKARPTASQPAPASGALAGSGAIASRRSRQRDLLTRLDELSEEEIEALLAERSGSKGSPNA